MTEEEFKTGIEAAPAEETVTAVAAETIVSENGEVVVEAGEEVVIDKADIVEAAPEASADAETKAEETAV